MIHRGPGFPGVIWFGYSPTLLVSKLDRRHTERFIERQMADGRRGLGVGEEPISNDGVKVWFSINHSMFSGLSERSLKLTMTDEKMGKIYTILNTADNGIRIQAVPVS
jgi:hypothetical protein